MRIHVYPDYTSTGLWNDNGASLDDETYIQDACHRIGLKYWHFCWEQWDLDNYVMSEPPRKDFLEYGYRKWWEDGQKLVGWVMLHYPEHQWVYEAETPEEMIKRYYGDEE